MKPTELRDEIPALDSTTYMNTGASGPSPTRVVEAIEECVEYHEYESPTDEGMYSCAFNVFDETREAVADHFNVDATEIALTQSTTDGINRIAAALDWERGDTVVRTDLEHSSGILPWKRLKRHGVEVEVVETEAGRLDMDAMADAVRDAKLVCLSSLTWSHGTRLPVEAVTEMAHDAGALVLVDAVQSPGQMPVDFTEWGADFAAGAGHKWLLGSFGAGFVHVSPGAETHLEPAHIGYRSVEDPNAEEYVYKPGAHRLEVGTASPAPYAGLREGIQTIEDVGYKTIQDRVQTLTDGLKQGIENSETTRLLSPREYESGLVAFEVDDTDPETFVEELAEEGVQIRPLPFPENAVRASVHVFNTKGDVDELVEFL